MKRPCKFHQLQVRVTAQEKAAVRRAASDAGMEISSWVLSRLLPSLGEEFQARVAALNYSAERKAAFAGLNDFLVALTDEEFLVAVAAPPRETLDRYLMNYLAAMIEIAAQQKNALVPPWVSEIAPLEKPQFGVPLKSVRLHLLTNSPAAFRRRNIFVDSTLGDRV